MLEYRRELDGLRALAVIAVLFYHANFMLWKTPLMRGGFLGVDVFFVLSGFLITGIIRYAMDNGSFRFLDFYLRRFRRIVPALLVILTISALGAWFVLFSGDLIKFAESLRSALYFGSNYYFYGEDSYTALASIFKPLLHTWSLAVEWQFYIVYPFVFWFLYRYFPRYCPVILVGLAVVSLCYAQWQSMVSPDWSFYFLPTRAWELLFGGVLVFVRRDALPPVCRRIGKWMPLLGFVMLMVSMVSFSDKITHPSFLTFIPVAGTMLIIVFAREDDWITRGLSWRPVVYIGLISYSIYLWHQPVMGFDEVKRRVDNPYERIKNRNFTGEIVPSMEGWRSFAANINRLIDMGHQVTVVYPVPLPDIDVKNEVLRQLRNDRKLHKVYGSRKQYDKAMEYTATLDSVLPDRKGLTKVRPMDVFCEKDGRCLLIDEQSGIYNKNGHLSHHAAEVLIDNYILPAGKH